MREDYSVSIPKEIIGPSLIELAEKDDRIVVFSSDVSVSCNVEMFHKRFPHRFFEMGIAEQSTMSVAGGIASEGFIPVYVALSIFSCGMTWAQMRQICNNNLNVKIIGTHAGVDDGQDGSGHHATEDIAISRAIPRMTVLTPSDENEVRSALFEMIKYDGPVYARVAREPQPIIHNTNIDYVIGEAEIIKDNGDDYAIIYEGTALDQALSGFILAENRGKKGKLISVRSIKPIDKDVIISIAHKVNTIVTVENHSLVGGLYSAVCETLGGCIGKALVRGIGFDYVFMESGAAKDIKDKYGLSGERICQAIGD